MSTVQTMRTFRLLLLAAGGLVVALGVLVALAFWSPFQTWIVRRALASRPEIRATVGVVSAGLNRVELRDLEWHQSGLVARVPLLEARLPLVPALFSERLAVVSLKARGWVIEPVAASQPVGGGPGESRGAGAGTAGANASAVIPVAGGFLARVALPFDLALDGVDLEGEVRLPDGHGRILARVTGGGFGVGRAGRVEITTDAILVAPELNAVSTRAVLIGRMDTARSLSRLEVEFQTTARGARFPAGLELAGTLTAGRSGDGESYTARVRSHGRDLLSLQAEYPRDSARWRGGWQSDFNETDLAALALGLRIPAFAATGGGTFEWDPARDSLQAKGRLNGTVDRLGTVWPELAAVGRLTVAADFDLGAHDGALSVRRLDAAFAGATPVVTIRVLQPFVFHGARRELTASDPAGELVGISLHGLPVAWLSQWFAPYQVRANALRGELVARARGRGLVVNSASPLVLDALLIRRGDDVLVEGADVRFSAGLDYAPQGWAVEIVRLAVTAGGRGILNLDAKAGHVAGPDDAIKLSAKFTTDLPALLTQPVLRGTLALVEGEGAVEVAASLGAAQSWHVKASLQGMAAGTPSELERLPALSVDLRTDIGADGRVEYHVPIAIEHGDRKSDLLVKGKGRINEGKLEAIEATAASRKLHVEDLQAFGRALNEPPAPADTVAGSGIPARVPAPPWAGWSGAVGLRLDEVVYTDTFRLNNVAGKAALDAGRIRIEGLDAGLGHRGRAQIKGALMYDADRSLPYGLVVDVDVRDFDPGMLLRRAGGVPEPVFEGRVDVTGSIAGRAHTIARLPSGVAGDWHLASKGGVFRGLPAVVNVAAGSPGRVAGFLAAAGQAIGGLARRREGTIVSSRPEAMAEFVAALNPLPFDQLSLRMVHDAGLRASLTDFTLIAPELRLSGAGTLSRREGAPLIGGALAMEYRLRARGRQGELLKHLGALDAAAADELGYSACTLPIRIGGTLMRPDVSEFNVRLEALAFEKGGVTERASELFNRLIGAGK